MLSKILKEKYEKVKNKEVTKYLEFEREREAISNKIYFEEGFKEGLKLIKYFL